MFNLDNFDTGTEIYYFKINFKTSKFIGTLFDG